MTSFPCCTIAVGAVWLGMTEQLCDRCTDLPEKNYTKQVLVMLLFAIAKGREHCMHRIDAT